MARGDLFLDSLKEAWSSENFRRLRELTLEWEEEHRRPFERELVFPVQPEGTVVRVRRSVINLVANTPLRVYNDVAYPISWRLVAANGEDISSSVTSAWLSANRESGLTLESNRSLSNLRLFVHQIAGASGA